MRFQEIPGLQSTKAHLIDSIRRGRVSHAQLFAGAEGRSHFQMALAYAQYLLCKNPGESDSCGNCSNCQAMGRLSHPDMHFIFPIAKTKDSSKKPVSDEFSRRFREFIAARQPFSLHDWLAELGIENKQGLISVNEAASILHKINLKAFGGDAKILLIWLPELMHPSAANKLLKSLEEPEANTYLLLVSNNAERVLQTVVSRCQIVHVDPHRKEDVQASLEKQGVEPAQAEQAAALSNGNMLEANKLASSSQRFINYAELFKDWARACFKADALGIFKATDRFSKLDREQQKEALDFYTQIVGFAFAKKESGASAQHPTFQAAQFNLDKFAPFVHVKNGRMIYEALSKGLYDISRNANAGITFSDMSFKISRYFHMKE